MKDIKEYKKNTITLIGTICGISVSIFIFALLASSIIGVVVYINIISPIVYNGTNTEIANRH